MNVFLSATEAAAELGVSVATLYAYVSRGMIRAEARAGSRKKLYLAADVRALSHRHTASAQASLPSGTPEVIETALTLIHNDRLYYRGIDMESLAAQARLEAVASLLWGHEGDDPFAAACSFKPHPHFQPDFGVISRQISGLAASADHDLAAYTRTPAAIARCGARIIRQLVTSTVELTECEVPVHLTLARGWQKPGAADFIRTALVAMADHELAASTLAVRVAASTGATPWRAVTAGLCTLDGPKHGRASQRVQRFLASLDDAPSVAAGIATHLALGDPLPGFGHVIYQGEDPRNRVLLQAVKQLGNQAAYERAQAIIRDVELLTGLKPNLDFGLAIGCDAAGLPQDAPKALFAIARSAGWIGHIIEQSGTDRLMRMRARYVGVSP